MAQNEKNVQIIAPVGLAGSGKSAVSDYIVNMGYPKVYFGGVIYDAMEKAGIEKGEDNETKFRIDIRKREGNDFVVKNIVEQIRGLIGAGQKRIVADGIYSWDEYKIMKREFPGELTVVAVVAPKKLRHRRLNDRPERPLTNAEADQRDWSEIETIQKGGPIAIADYFVTNDGNIEKLESQIDNILSEIKFRD